MTYLREFWHRTYFQNLLQIIWSSTDTFSILVSFWRERVNLTPNSFCILLSEKKAKQATSQKTTPNFHFQSNFHRFSRVPLTNEVHRLKSPLRSLPGIATLVPSSHIYFLAPFCPTPYPMLQEKQMSSETGLLLTCASHSLACNLSV